MSLWAVRRRGSHAAAAGAETGALRAPPAPPARRVSAPRGVCAPWVPADTPCVGRHPGLHLPPPIHRQALPALHVHLLHHGPGELLQHPRQRVEVPESLQPPLLRLLRAHVHHHILSPRSPRAARTWGGFGSLSEPLGSCGDASGDSGEPLERFGEALGTLWRGFGEALARLWAGIHPPCAIFPSVVLVLKDTEVPHAGDRKLESRLITLGAHPRRGTAGRSK